MFSQWGAIQNAKLVFALVLMIIAVCRCLRANVRFEGLLIVRYQCRSYAPIMLFSTQSLG